MQHYGLQGAALGVSLSAAGAALYQLAWMLRLVSPSFHEATEMVRVGVLGSVLFGLAAVIARPGPSLLFLAIISLAVAMYLFFLARLLLSHFGPFAKFTWARSLKERLTV
jgi:hypothetical protein